MIILSKLPSFLFFFRVRNLSYFKQGNISFIPVYRQKGRIYRYTVKNCLQLKITRNIALPKTACTVYTGMNGIPIFFFFFFFFFIFKIFFFFCFLRYIFFFFFFFFFYKVENLIVQLINCFRRGGNLQTNVLEWYDIMFQSAFFLIDATKWPLQLYKNWMLLSIHEHICYMVECPNFGHPAPTYTFTNLKFVFTHVNGDLLFFRTMLTASTNSTQST